MGTWHMPQTEKQKLILFRKLVKLRKLRDSILNSLGDDTTLDGFDIALDRIEKFCTHVTMECVHPAIHENGSIGVCKLCRSKVEHS